MFAALKKGSVSLFDKGQSFICAELKVTAGQGLRVFPEHGTSRAKTSSASGPTTLRGPLRL